MKIKKFEAENFKKLVVVEIEPDGNLVQITGKNGNGKTSVLDAIWVTLAGMSVSPENPIRDGQAKARIRLDLGEIVVTRTFKDKAGGYTSSIVVENAEGTKLTSPQALLDGLLGQMAFDPLEFDRMDNKGKFEQLRRFVPDVDFLAIDAANEGDYAKRTEANRKAKEARTLADSLKFDKNTPLEPVDVSNLVDELQKGGEFNANIDKRKNNRGVLAIKIKDRKKEIERLDTEILRITTQRNELSKAVDEDQAKLDAAAPLPAEKDLTELRRQIDNAGTINQQISLRDEKGEYIKAAQSWEVRAEAFTTSINARNADKKTKIAAAKLPVENITFEGSEVMLGGQPFEQGSDAEKLHASIAISMALNPKLRIIRVRDGSLLDSKSLKLLAEMADKRDYQVWIERVDESGKVGFILEDGQIKQSRTLIEGDE